MSLGNVNFVLKEVVGLTAAAALKHLHDKQQASPGSIDSIANPAIAALEV